MPSFTSLLRSRQFGGIRGYPVEPHVRGFSRLRADLLPPDPRTDRIPGSIDARIGYHNPEARTDDRPPMKMLTTSKTIEAPARVLWELLVDPRRWPEWGPTVRKADIDGGGTLRAGSTGTVTTVAGPTLNFVVTDFEAGVRWAWKVASLPATGHHVEPLGPHRCLVTFSVPWVAAPYLAVCRAALRSLEGLARREDVLE